MLRAAAGSSRRLPLATRTLLAPASNALLRHSTPAMSVRTTADDRAPHGAATLASVRELSTSSALSRMGSLSVDPLAANTTVQGVEYVLTGFDKLVNWARKSSMWPMTFGLA